MGIAAVRSPESEFCENSILPALIDLSMRNKHLRPYRERVAGAAEGRVLEIGIGSGINLPFYARQAEQIFGLDPSPRLLARARRKAKRTEVDVQLLTGSAESIPLADRSIDTVVTTWTACSIPEIATALGEMRRVLKRVAGVSCSSSTGWRRNRASRGGSIVSRRCGGASGAAAHLNRKIDDLIGSAGFRIDRIETGYIPGPSPVRPTSTKASRYRAQVLQSCA